MIAIVEIVIRKPTVVQIIQQPYMVGFRRHLRQRVPEYLQRLWVYPGIIDSGDRSNHNPQLRSPLATQPGQPTDAPHIVGIYAASVLRLRQGVMPGNVFQGLLPPVCRTALSIETMVQPQRVARIVCPPRR